MTSETASEFVPIKGSWSFDGAAATYRGPEDGGVRPVGVCLTPSRFRSGTICVKAKLHDSADAAARVVIGYHAVTGGYYSIGLGGYKFAYLTDRFTRGTGWEALQGLGRRAHYSRTTSTASKSKSEASGSHCRSMA